MYLDKIKSQSRFSMIVVALAIVSMCLTMATNDQITRADDFMSRYEADLVSSSAPIPSYDTPDYAQSVSIFNDLLCVADNDTGLIVLNISTGVDPTLVDSCDTPGEALDVVAAENVAYIADGDAGVQIINLTDPSDYEIIKTIDTPGNAKEIMTNGDLLYVADGSGGLQIINVSNPLTASIIGACPVPGSAVSLDLYEEKVYIAANNTGLQIADISDPMTPNVIESFSPGGLVQSVVVNGRNIIITDDTSGLIVLNQTDISSLETLSTCSDLNAPFMVRYHAFFAYVLDNDGVVKIVNITDTADANLVGNISLVSAVNDISIHNHRAYLCRGELGIKSVEIATKYYWDGGIQHGFMETIGLDPTVSSGSISDPIGVYRDYVIMFNDKYGKTYGNCEEKVYMYDVSNPSNPYIIDNITISANIMAMTVSHDTAYLYIKNDTTQGFLALNLTDPYNMSIYSNYTFSYVSYGEQMGLFIDGDLAYVGLERGLGIINISDPTDLDEVSITDVGSIKDVLVDGDFAYVVTTNAIKVLNISDAINPQYIEYRSIRHYSMQQIAYYRGFLYYETSSDQITIFDCSDPYNLLFVGQLDFNGDDYVFQFGLYNGILYYGGFGCYLYQYNLSNPAIPKKIQTSPLPQQGFIVDRDIMYTVFFTGFSTVKTVVSHVEDYDSDGFTGFEEVYIIGTDPFDVDSDQDGLDDYFEIVELGSNPLSTDSDGDSIPDLWEHTNGLNASKYSDAAEDLDADGLNNSAEFENLLDPNDPDWDNDGLLDSEEVLEHNTNPFENDTDNDGLEDYYEVSNDLDPCTDDSASDPDSDGLSNLEEFSLNTSPTNSDSDGDGFLDGAEVFLEYDPLDSDDHPPIDKDVPIYLIVGIMTGAFAIATGVLVRNYLLKRNLINVAVIHLPGDSKKFRINQLSEHLQERKEIYNVINATRLDSRESFMDWLRSSVKQTHVGVFCISRQMFDRPDITKILQYLRSMDYLLIPLIGNKVTWQELQGLGVQELGFEMDQHKYAKIFAEINLYLQNFNDELYALLKVLKQRSVSFMEILKKEANLSEKRVYQYSLILLRSGKLSGAWLTDKSQFLRKDEVEARAKPLLDSGIVSNFEDLIEKLNIKRDNTPFVKEIFKIKKGGI